MVNGWDWVQEGQRIAEESARAAELNIEAIKSASIVFEGPLDTIKARQIESNRVADMVRELENCRAGHCEAAYKQNSIGGEARYVVHKIAEVVGQPLHPALDRKTWSPANMGRVIAAVQELINENEALRKELANRNDIRILAALREALLHTGEAV